MSDAPEDGLPASPAANSAASQPVKGKRRALTVLALVFAGMALGSWWQSRNASNASQGDPSAVRPAAFWQASLPDLEDRPQALRQWQGKVVLVNFWAPWCPPCRREIPGFIRQQDALGAQGFQIVGIALDDKDKVAAYIEAEGVNYPVLLGGLSAARLGEAAGNRLGGLPYSVLFDRQGNAVATFTGALSEEHLLQWVKPLL